MTLEDMTLTYWETSLACNGDPRYATNQTFQTVIEALHPLRTQGQHHRLRYNAELLVDMMVYDRTNKQRNDNGNQNPCSEIIIANTNQ